MNATDRSAVPMNLDPLELANPLCGSDSDLTFSTGLTYPAVTSPWGMTAWSPRNRWMSQVFCRRRSSPVNRIAGFTATHAPSPWMGDYGTFTLAPLVGAVSLSRAKRERSYRLADESSRPNYYAVRHVDSGMLCELTATSRCGLLRMSYPSPTEAKLVLELDTPQCTADVHREQGRITGIARGYRGGVAGDFGCRFVIEVDCPITDAQWIENDDRALVLTLNATPTRPVTVRIGTSFISTDQAALNLRREVGDHDFDAVRQSTGDVWREELQRVQVTGGTHTQQRTLYTCLWRALLFPRTFHEQDADGKLVHFSPYTGRVEPGPLVTDNGFWDTSRTVYSLLALGWRKRLGDILDGWLTAYRESGWMPQWASPGHRSCMVGTHSAAVFADAITRGITGFDHQLAYESMKKDATTPGDPNGAFGRQQLDDYLKLGYCPEVGADDSVCRTLDYSYNDWCCAQVADILGHHDDAAMFRERSSNWRNLFDADLKFFRPKLTDGAWATPFHEFRWGGPYREGSAWQFRFAVPHDIPGLAKLFGGNDVLVRELERMIDTPPRFEVGHYDQEIHEMTEMAAADFGQYAHSNQPVHAFLWSAAQVGRPDVTDRLVRRVLNELYTPETFPGDEDNGEMGAWYVLASIGLFPHCPGSPTFTTTPSLFDSVEVHGDDGHVLKLPSRSGATLRQRGHALTP